MLDKLSQLESVLEAMLMDDETISARAAVRRSQGLLKHPTDITRNSERMTLVSKYSERQRAIRTSLGRKRKQSNAKLEQLLAQKDQEIERLVSEKELLIASHRAMILSIAELGGFQTWKRFFDKFQSTLSEIEKMGALPQADVLNHPAHAITSKLNEKS